MINFFPYTPKKIILFLSIFFLFIFGFLAGIAPAVWSGGYLTTPDSYTIVNYAQHILDNHQIVPHSVYQFLQIITAGVSFATGLTATQSFILLTALAVASLSVVTFFLGKTIFQSDAAGFLSGFFAISLPFIGRAIVLTPQNIFGFLFYVCALYTLVRFLDRISMRRGIAFIISLALLFVAHPLSFGAFLISLGVYFPIYWWGRFGWKMRFIGLFGFVFFGWLGTTLISFILTGSLDAVRFLSRFLVEISTTGLAEPIINFSTYSNTFAALTVNSLVIAILVYLLSSSKTARHKWLIFSLFAAPLGWANLYHLGINFLSYRVILFLWLPACILISYLILWYKKFSKSSALIVCSLFILSFSVIGFRDIYYHYDSYGKNFVPTENDEIALRWLEDNIKEPHQILTIERWPQIQGSIFHLIYPRLSFFFVPDLTESLDEPKLPEITAEAPANAKWLGKLILKSAPKEVLTNVAQFDKQAFQHRLDLFYATKFPDSQKGNDAIDKWNITHAYIFKNIQEYDFFKKSSKFTLIYQNDTVGIFQRIVK